MYRLKRCWNSTCARATLKRPLAYAHGSVKSYRHRAATARKRSDKITDLKRLEVEEAAVEVVAEQEWCLQAFLYRSAIRHHFQQWVRHHQ